MNQQSKNLHNIVIIVIIGVLIVSIGIWWRQKLNTETIKQNMQGEINNLKYQLSQSQIIQNELEQLIESNISGSTGEMKNENILVKNNIIYDYHAERYTDNEDYITQFIMGFIEDNKNYIFSDNHIFVFEGDLSKVSFNTSPGKGSFSYNNLEISTGFAGPYGLYKPVDPNKITYECDGSLINFNGKDFTDLGREKVNHQYCKTNNKDFLTQYEFSAADGAGFSTGGEITETWYKLYIKNINGVNYIFNGRLFGNYIDWPDFFDEKQYRKISSKKYLDTILQDEKNKKRIKEWDEFVESL